MKYTVLQSVYKGENPLFLDESLKSLASQTLFPDRIVLVKDGKLPKNLEDVITKWKKHLPLFVVGYEKNLGLAHALNYGLKFIETELVARMDSDDISFPDRFEKEVLRFEIEPELAILGTGIEEFYFPNDSSSSRPNFKRVRLYPESTTKKSKKLYKGTPLAHPTVMMKTSLLKKFCYNEKTRCNEDIDLWFRLLDSGVTIKTLQEPLLHFRITDKTFSRRSFSKALAEYRIYSCALRSFNGLTPLDAFLFMRLLCRFFPRNLSKKIYLSSHRNKLFQEMSMKVKYLENSVFLLESHLFQALFESEKDGVSTIKAVQLDTDIENIVDVPSSSVRLLRLKSGMGVSLSYTPPPRIKYRIIDIQFFDIGFPLIQKDKRRVA